MADAGGIVPKVDALFLALCEPGYPAPQTAAERRRLIHAGIALACGVLNGIGMMSMTIERAGEDAPAKPPQASRRR